MLHKCPKDANGIKAPYLISWGRIFITDDSDHAKKRSELFKKYMPCGFHEVSTLFLA